MQLPSGCPGVSRPYAGRDESNCICFIYCARNTTVLQPKYNKNATGSQIMLASRIVLEIADQEDWVFLNFFQRYSQISVIYRPNDLAVIVFHSIKAVCFIVWNFLVCIKQSPACYRKSKSARLLTRSDQLKIFWENIEKNRRNTQCLRAPRGMPLLRVDSLPSENVYRYIC